MPTNQSSVANKKIIIELDQSPAYPFPYCKLMIMTNNADVDVKVVAVIAAYTLGNMLIDLILAILILEMDDFTKSMK